MRQHVVDGLDIVLGHMDGHGCTGVLFPAIVDGAIQIARDQTASAGFSVGKSHDFRMCQFDGLFGVGVHTDLFGRVGVGNAGLIAFLIGASDFRVVVDEPVVVAEYDGAFAENRSVFLENVFRGCVLGVPCV